MVRGVILRSMSSALSPAASQLLGLIRAQAVSRQELHRKTGWRPNTVGDVVAEMLDAGLISEGTPIGGGPGRPRVPLRIDPGSRVVLGVALMPGHVEVTRQNLLGETLAFARTDQGLSDAGGMAAAQALMAQHQDEAVLAAGICSTGLLDPARRELLVSTAATSGTSIAPLLQGLGKMPVLLQNDMQAMAAHWLLTEAELGATEDVLLVHLRDGAIGASLLVDGRPNRGSVAGGNELGFAAVPGQTKRLEQLFSSAHLSELSGQAEDLGTRLAHLHPADEQVGGLVDLLGLQIANAVNLVRPSRLVLASQWTRHDGFMQRLRDTIAHWSLPPLHERLSVSSWPGGAHGSAENAGWLALAHLYRPMCWQAMST